MVTLVRLPRILQHSLILTAPRGSRQDPRSSQHPPPRAAPHRTNHRDRGVQPISSPTLSQRTPPRRARERNRINGANPYPTSGAGPRCGRGGRLRGLGVHEQFAVGGRVPSQVEGVQVKEPVAQHDEARPLASGHRASPLAAPRPPAAPAQVPGHGGGLGFLGQGPTYRLRARRAPRRVRRAVPAARALKRTESPWTAPSIGEASPPDAREMRRRDERDVTESTNRFL